MIIHASLDLAPSLGPDQLRACGRLASWWAGKCRGDIVRVDPLGLNRLKAGKPVSAITVEVDLALDGVNHFAAALHLLLKVSRCRWLFAGVRIDAEALRRPRQVLERFDGSRGS